MNHFSGLIDTYVPGEPEFPFMDWGLFSVDSRLFQTTGRNDTSFKLTSFAYCLSPIFIDQIPLYKRHDSQLQIPRLNIDNLSNNNLLPSIWIRNQSKKESLWLCESNDRYWRSWTHVSRGNPAVWHGSAKPWYLYKRMGLVFRVSLQWQFNYGIQPYTFVRNWPRGFTRCAFNANNR